MIDYRILCEKKNIYIYEKKNIYIYIYIYIYKYIYKNIKIETLGIQPIATSQAVETNVYHNNYIVKLERGKVTRLFRNIKLPKKKPEIFNKLEVLYKAPPV
jgi:hypothetical protein